MTNVATKENKGRRCRPGQTAYMSNGMAGTIEEVK